MTPPKAAALALVALTMGVTAGCGTANPQVSIGMRASGLDLEFTNPKLVKPVPPNVIVQVIPAPPGVTPQELGQYVVPASAPLPPPSLPRSPWCPKAPRDSVPAKNATFDVAAPPPAGDYVTLNSGYTQVAGGTSTLRVPVPSNSYTEVGPFAKITPSGASSAPSPGGEGSAPVAQYSVTTVMSPKFSETDTLRITPTQIDLVERVTRDGTRTIVFTPDVPMSIYTYNAEGGTWNSVGVDSTNESVLAFQGTFGPRQRIDVCGQLVDTYQITYTERFVDLTTGEQITTSPSDTSYYNIATEYGGLLVRRHVNITDTRADTVHNTQLSLTMNYTSVLTAIHPNGKRAPQT